MPTSALDGNTPYYYWKKKKPDISYLCVFGCLAYVLIHKKKRKALQPHSKSVSLLAILMVSRHGVSGIRLIRGLL
jgi:hypothetical protein